MKDRFHLVHQSQKAKAGTLEDIVYIVTDDSEDVDDDSYLTTKNIANNLVTSTEGSLLDAIQGTMIYCVCNKRNVKNEYQKVM